MALGATAPTLGGGINWKTLPNALDHVPWYKNSGLVRLWASIFICYMGQFLNGYDGTITGSLQALPLWLSDLGYPNASRIGLLNAMSYIAGVVTGPLAAYTADRFGRKANMRYYSVTMLLGTILGCIAGIPQLEGKGYALFCVSKFIIGSGLATALMTMQILLQELSHPRHRPICAAAFNQSWTLGHVLSAWITFGTSRRNDSWSWRTPYLVQGAFALYILVAVSFVPESPRWLAAQGRLEEARAWLIKYHGNGDEDDELVGLEWEELRGAIEAEKEAKQEKWSVLLKSKSNRYRLFLAALFTVVPQWDGAAIINFYYSQILAQVGITGAATVTGIGAGLSMWSWAVQIAPFLIAFNVAVTAASAMYDKTGSSKSGIAAVFFVWMYSGADSFVTGLFYRYDNRLSLAEEWRLPSECLSFSLRAKGMSVWNTANQLTGLYNAYVNSVALSAIGWRYYTVFLALLFIWYGALWYFMPETYGLTLEEIDILFTGKDSPVAAIDARLEAGLPLDDATVAQTTRAGDEKDKESI
ncbi:hypothetical protein JCM10213v2_007107 [Rhodosporidiobolus nylandii]